MLLRYCLGALLLLTLACGRREEPPPLPTTAAAKSDSPVDALLKGFADAILAKDYARA